MSIQRLIFFVLSALFFIGSSMWIKDEFSPKWIKYQKEYYKEQAIKVENEYSAASSAKEKELLGKRLASLKRPVYEVKQILLKGDYSWDKGQNVAHKGIYYHKRQMEQRLVAAEPLFEFWSELATLTPEESDPNQRVEMGDFKKYSITGDKAIYVGSQKCLKCHTGLTSPHVERWLRIKFKTFERVKESPDYIAGNEGYRKACLKCHTTGYDETTGRYSEEGVTCEACHGAGEVFAYFMDIGKALEGQKIAKVGTFGTPYNICGPCHHTRNHEMRLKFFQERGGDDEWFFPQHTTPYKTGLTEKGDASKSLPKIY